VWEYGRVTAGLCIAGDVLIALVIAAALWLAWKWS
jgi:hypothetical protein